MNNPLRQYFRRPALFISLPSKGNYYPENTIDLPVNGELPVFPMTAIDEITSKTPDALFNGSALVELIKSCVPNIKDPWGIPLTDLDTILIAIRTATNGNDLEIESVCPSCEEESKYSVNLIGLLSEIKVSGYDESFTLGELIFNFKPLSYREANKGNMKQFELQKEIQNIDNLEDIDEKTKRSKETLRKLTEANVELMSATIGSITTPTDVVTSNQFIKEFLEGCDRNTFDQIRSKVVALREESNVKPLSVKCPHCSHEYTQPISLNPTDFFG